MSTRSLTHVRSHDFGRDCTLVTIYRQCDGYPEGIGVDIARILNGGEVVNGIPVGAPPALRFNGAGCLAAHLIKHLKRNVGGVYIERSNAKDCGEDYTYVVHVGTGATPPIVIECFEGQRGGPLVYSGTPAEWINKYGKE